MNAAQAGQAVSVEPLAQDVLATVSETETVHGSVLSVLCQEYSDRTLVLVTQLGKIGYLVQVQVYPARQDAQHMEQDTQPAMQFPVTSTVPLFGAPPRGMEDLYALYATRIAAWIYASQHTPEMSVRDVKPVVVGLALPRVGKDDDLDTERVRMEAVQRLVNKCRVW
ncbi:hypothetical protein MVES1_003270 [Malassezia vespertilionis]|uniref:Uncharacterized protein n=1 Tax=Malassezia vespertilionis TaxID=2020962 RepID=A0A2N1J953_9BASI|nr:uncharacterized protein MVES1_003270 [Malassezia vespertilionis]PKI83087.1 hypothetical protein MVES_003108 [Malassezia vespertilionis]WFD07902.1 hypothetical protein MVES1_003270 [Malassezia vespertilionis]